MDTWKKVAIGIGAAAALAAIVLLVGWLGFGWFRSEAAPQPTFYVADCDKFESTTGYPLDLDKSNVSGKCEYPEPAKPPVFDSSTCSKFDASTGYPFDEAASKIAGECTYPKPAAPPAPATGTPIPPPVTVSDFPKTPREVIDLFKLKDENGLELSETWVIPCPWGESQCWEIKMSPVFASNPFGYWVEGFRHYAGELRPGGYAHPERSGLPPNSTDVLIDSGLTIRPEGDYSVAPTPGPMTWETVLETVDIAGFPSDLKFLASFYGIDRSQAYPFACGENNCLIIRPLAPNKSFSVKNGACWQDGYRMVGGEIRVGFEQEADAPKISVSPHYSGPVAEFVIRPCAEDQAAMLAMNPTPTPTPAP